MNFTQAIQSCFAKYATFSGRSLRSEFWYFVLFILIAQAVAAMVDYSFGVNLFESAVGLVTLLPGLAVQVRRLHDIDRSGWWLLLSFIPVIGVIVLLVWFCRRGDPSANQYGLPV